MVNACDRATRMLGIDEGKPTFASERNVVRPALIDEEHLEDVSGEHRMHRNAYQAAPAARKAASLSTTMEHRNSISRSCPAAAVLTTTFRHAYGPPAGEIG